MLFKADTPPGKVIHNDCRNGMATLDDNSVHLILTDPPYFLDGMGDDWNTDKLNEGADKGGLIKGLPGGMKFDPEQGKRLQEFMTPVAESWMRVIRPGGFVLAFSQNRLAHRMAIAIEDAGFEVRDMLAWHHTGQRSQAKSFTMDHFIRKMGLSKEYEAELIEKMGGRRTPQMAPFGDMIIMAQAPKDGTFVENFERWQTGLIDVQNPIILPSLHPGTIIPCDKPQKRHGHLTPKPVRLLAHLIKIFSVKGGLVMDPFAGSGSTGVAARVEGRDFIGWELDGKMAKIAQARIEETT